LGLERRELFVLEGAGFEALKPGWLYGVAVAVVAIAAVVAVACGRDVGSSRDRDWRGRRHRNAL
jgi:hypothetical protein